MLSTRLRTPSTVCRATTRASDAQDRTSTTALSASITLPSNQMVHVDALLDSTKTLQESVSPATSAAEAATGLESATA